MLCCLIRFTAGSVGLSVVDLYNINTGSWSQAELSVARADLIATSVGNVALFAGGATGAMLCEEMSHLLSVCERHSAALVITLRALAVLSHAIYCR